MADRPSWRDRDRRNDRSAHRQEPREGRRPQRGLETATAQYKKSLDAFFDKGDMPEHIKAKMEAAGLDTSKGPDPRTDALREVRNAKAGRPLVKAIDKLRKEFGLPEDLEILVRCLEHPDDAVLLETIELIEPQVDLGHPMPNKRVMVQRLKGLEFSSFDPRVQRRAVALAGKIK